MRLENQVTSLETSKKLKELGVEQESIFFWIQTYDSTLAPILNHSIARTPDVRGDLYLVDKSPNERNYSAFTTSELAEMLPEIIKLNDVINWVEITKYGKEYQVRYRTFEMPSKICGREKSLVEALAACLIHLKENKLI